MQLNTFMPKTLQPYFQKELDLAKEKTHSNHLPEAWYHLERAHILGQRYPYHHTLVHWKMLLFGIKIKNSREVLGQIPRLIVGGVKSFVGTIPVGNTGGANVPPLRPMEIPADLNAILIQNT